MPASRQNGFCRRSIPQRQRASQRTRLDRAISDHRRNRQRDLESRSPGTVLQAEAVASLNAALSPFEALIAAEALCVRALALAIDLRHPVYDCFYLALAERENAPLATADEGLIAAARKAKIKVRRI